MLQLILGKEDTNEITEIYYHNIVISFNYRYRNTCKCFCIIIRCNKTYLYTKNQQEKAKEITEDELKGLEKEIQKVTDDAVKHVDEMTAHKEKELMEV